MRDKTNGRDGADESVWRPFQASLHSPPLSLMSDTLPLTRVSKSFAAIFSAIKSFIQTNKMNCVCVYPHASYYIIIRALALLAIVVLNTLSWIFISLLFITTN